MMFFFQRFWSKVSIFSLLLWQLQELEGNLLKRVHDFFNQVRPKGAGMHCSVSACASFSLDEHRTTSPGGHLAVSRCHSSSLSSHGGGPWDDEEGSYADSGNHSAFVSQPNHERLVVDLWRLQQYRGEVKELQGSLCKCMPHTLFLSVLVITGIIS